MYILCVRMFYLFDIEILCVLYYYITAAAAAAALKSLKYRRRLRDARERFPEIEKSYKYFIVFQTHCGWIVIVKRVGLVFSRFAIGPLRHGGFWDRRFF